MQIFFMRKLLTILLFALPAMACNNNKEDKNKPATENNTSSDEKVTSTDDKETTVAGTENDGSFSIKSAKVVTRTTMPNNLGYSISTLYFDDYGKTRFTETVTYPKMQGPKTPPKKYTLHKDMYLYTWEEGKATGTKVNFTHAREIAKELTNMNYDKMAEDVLAEMKVKKGGTETFLGRTCNVLEFNSEETGIGKLLTWKNIPMLSDMKVMGQKVLAEVIELDENAAIDVSKFELPEGVEFRELSFGNK